MNVEIRALTPALAGDFFDFFENVAFTDHPDWAGCYCIHYNFGPSRERAVNDLSIHDRKACAEQYIEDGRLRGQSRRLFSDCTRDARLGDRNVSFETCL